MKDVTSRWWNGRWEGKGTNRWSVGSPDDPMVHKMMMEFHQFFLHLQAQSLPPLRTL